jgi:hypothetical protein
MSALRNIKKSRNKYLFPIVMFLERRLNMHGKYESKVDGMSMGVGPLNNSQVLVFLID